MNTTCKFIDISLPPMEYLIFTSEMVPHVFEYYTSSSSAFWFYADIPSQRLEWMPRGLCHINFNLINDRRPTTECR